MPPSHCPISSGEVRRTGSKIGRRREDERWEDCMERTDYISLSPHMPDCVTAKCPRDCGTDGRWRGGGSGVNWRKLSGGGRLRGGICEGDGASCGAGMNEMAGAGGRGRQADETFMKGKGKMMYRACELGPLSS